MKKHGFTIGLIRRGKSFIGLLRIADSGTALEKAVARGIIETDVDDGGAGSGNWGHKGRPGLRGGSGKGGGSLYRTGSKEGGYVSIAKASAFQSIATTARNSKDYKSFVSSLSKDQRQQILDQHRQTGSKESLASYTERLRQIMSAPPAKTEKAHFEIVEGKQLLDYKWNGEPYTDEKTGQVIDTDIEDVLHKQGFDGLPKVVSQEEFDRIIDEHPEMPILLRAYAAPNPETLAEYDKMLESGAWYVDCGTGGAQYGRGMYTAGVYPSEVVEVSKMDDPDFYPVRNMLFSDIHGNGYEPMYIVHPEDSGDLYTWTPYLLDDGQKKTLIVGKTDKDFIPRWTDANTGAQYSDDDIDEMIGKSTIYKCMEKDIGDYVTSPEESRKIGIERALREMEHYSELNIARCYENAGEGEKVNPQASTRIMTLDPSAKIITHSEIRSLMKKTAHDMAAAEIKEWAESRGQSETFNMAVEYYNRIFSDDYDGGNDYFTSLPKETQNKVNEMCTLIDKKAQEKRKELPRDYGVFAAAMGYDAINAEGHGASDSYTVVLNRTKVILSNQRVKGR